MSANFYDNSGLMAAIEPHTFVTIGPGFSPIPKLHPYVVAAPFCWPTATSYKRTATVTSGSWKMVQGGFDLYLVPHVPLPVLPPHPAQAIQQFKILCLSSSKARMFVHSVTGEGKPLATCLYGPLGANSNCAEPIALPLNLVLNFNSVKTSPTLGDYIGALAGYAVDAAFGALIGGMLNGAGASFLTEAILKHLLRRRGDILALLGLDQAASAADFPTWIQQWVQRVFDAE